MTTEEVSQLEFVKKHGLMRKEKCQPVPDDLRTGWWRISDINQFRNVISNCNMRGVRERELKTNVHSVLRFWHNDFNFQIEDELIELALLTVSEESLF